jgi:hypothetical protein
MFFYHEGHEDTKIDWVGLVVIEACHREAVGAVRFSCRGLAVGWIGPALPSP